MRKKTISQYALIHTYGISEYQLSQLRRNKIVKTEILNKLCTILGFTFVKGFLKVVL